MGIYHYLISDMHFYVVSESDGFSGESKFCTDVDKAQDSDIIVLELSHILDFPSDCMELKNILFNSQNGEYNILYFDKHKKIINKIIVNGKLDHFKAVMPKNQWLHPFENNIGEVIFRTAILSRSGIVVHSAGIEYNEAGILFSAPSGTGKSTQANLWRAYKKASILNGDRAALRCIGDKVYIYGTPWSGSSNEYLNSRAPLKGIIFLEQAKDNSIIKLSPSDAVKYMLPRCFMPYGSEELMDLAFKNIEEILNKVPSFVLKCLPDNEAVEMVGNCLGL